mmetsp:Transcript_152695/g.489765  ORF Transcript_152695/g.489765 Transcript_152695/m.489765 type:complete len:352 (+) Transcript_152695:4622-5677(+)
MASPPSHGPRLSFGARKHPVHHLINDEGVHAALWLRHQPPEDGIQTCFQSPAWLQHRLVEFYVPQPVCAPLLVQPHEHGVHLGVAVPHGSSGVVGIDGRILARVVAGIWWQRLAEEGRDVLVVEDLLEVGDHPLPCEPKVFLRAQRRFLHHQPVADLVVEPREHRGQAEHAGVDISSEVAACKDRSFRHEARHAEVELQVTANVSWYFVVLIFRQTCQVRLLHKLQLAAGEAGVLWVAVAEHVESRIRPVGVVAAVDDVAIDPCGEVVQCLPRVGGLGARAGGRWQAAEALLHGPKAMWIPPRIALGNFDRPRIRFPAGVVHLVRHHVAEVGVQVVCPLRIQDLPTLQVGE